MRYRPLSPTGDYTIGQAWLINSPACVAQAVLTRLKLWMGEWFVDTTDGTPWTQGVLGKQYHGDPNAYVKSRILYTPGVKSLLSYSSTFTGASRSFSLSATIDTIYSAAGSSTAVVTLTN